MSNDTALSFDDIVDRLEAVEAQFPHSPLLIPKPTDEHGAFLNALCQCYVDASSRERRLIRGAVAGKTGVLDCLLGIVYVAAEQVRETRDRHWLRIGLAAAAIQDGGNDPRDFLLALAELYVTAEEVGLDPRREARSTGGVPANFETYAVVKSRRR